MHLGQALLDTYEAATRDLGIREVIPFYRCLAALHYGRALQLQQAEEEAWAAYDLACSSAARPKQPWLFITMGVSGSGKSLMARTLARRLPAIWLASDRIRKELAEVPPTARLGQGYYSPEWNARTYAELRKRAAYILQHQEHVILDATFSSVAERETTAAFATERGVEIWVLECSCSEDVARTRILRRMQEGEDPSDATPAVHDGQRQRYLPASGPWVPAERLTLLNTEGQPHELARQVLTQVWLASTSSLIPT
jgi:predicted kinase